MGEMCKGLFQHPLNIGLFLQFSVYEGWFGCRFDLNVCQHRSSADTSELLFPHQAAVTKYALSICVIFLLHDVHKTAMLEEKTVTSERSLWYLIDQHGVGEKNENSLLITLFP